MHRLSDFAGLVGAHVLRDASFALTGKLSTPLDGLLVPLRSAKYLDDVNSNPRVSAVVTTSDIAEGIDPRIGIILADRPDDVHAGIHVLLAAAHDTELRARPTVIDPLAHIDPMASIATYGVTIGAGVHVGPMCVLLPGVTIEEECVLHPGVTLGLEGFNSITVDGRRRIMPQLGGVRLKPRVELLAQTCVARALFGGETTIGEETLTDNLVYIAHDCQIGYRVQICALATILGRVVIGDEAYIGPSSTIINGARVGAKAKVSMGAVVTQDVAENATVSGNFAIDHAKFLGFMRSVR